MGDAIRTEAAPAAIGPYSQAIEVDGWLWCSGQIALDPATGEMVGETAADQAAQCLKNLSAVLTAGGAWVHDVVRCTIYLTDLGDFQAVNEVYAGWVHDPPPARACVEVSALPRGARVEIDAVARLKKR